MTSFREGVCETNGIALHYLRTGGEGASVVLLHGLMGSGACWTPVARGLPEGLDVVMPDARGHGESDAPAQGYRYDDHAADVIGLIETLGLDSPVVVGHSMGGMTAAVVASKTGARLGGVVLVDPTFLSPARQREVWESDVAAEHQKILGSKDPALLDRLRARQSRRPPELAELLIRARFQTRMSAFEVLAPPNPEYRALVASLEVPTLLALGDRPVVTYETAQELQGLNARLTLTQLADAGHGVPYDQPAPLAAAITSFVNSLRGAAAHPPAP